MLNQYKNINQINASRNSVSGQRFSETLTDLFAYAQEKYPVVTEVAENPDDVKVELHVYSNDQWITGNHSVQPVSKIPEIRDIATNEIVDITNPIGIDLTTEFDNLNVTVGSFKIAINFFKNLIGSYNYQHLRIDEISTDRTELRLRAIDSDNADYLQQIVNYTQTVDQTKLFDERNEIVGSARNQQNIVNTIETPTLFKTYLLNFSRNQNFVFVNSVVSGEYLYIKLLDPLPEQFELNFKCWIVEEIKHPYIDNVVRSVVSSAVQSNKLAGPNWDASSQTITSTDTGLKTWTDLLGSSTQTSQQIVDVYFSGSLSGVKLNIDYSDFNNFIFYSSATERLENFKYKLELLEFYASQSSTVGSLSGSVASNNAQEFLSLKSSLIGGFDSFEQFLYYQSSSILTTHDIPLIDATVPELTGSYINPVPKSNSTVPYVLYPISSSQFKNWYDGLYESASFYDTYNANSLINVIPDHIKFSNNTEQLTSFVNMLGHHYDILYTYINHMTRINKREENPKLGMPNELLYSVAKQFGWNLTDGRQGEDLWKYVLGTNEAGIPLTGSNTVGDPSVPGRDITYSIWRRIVNNLPFLLKTKGTKRSINALLSCYGIPQSMISIQEFGGPRLERTPVYEKLNFDYALDLSGSAAGTVVVNYTQPINAVELRFKTANVLKYPTMPSTMNLYNIGSNSVTIDFSSGTKGVIQINGTGSAEFELFNGEWINTLLRTNGTNLDLVAKKSKYGKIVATVSASASASFASTGTLTLGSTSTGASRLLGQLQELRLWTSSLQDEPFANHTKAPSAYNANVDAYDELVFRLPLTQKIDHAATSSLTGAQPKTSAISASFASWTLNTPYDSVEETYYYDAISLGAGTFDDNKIRLESNELVGTLDIKTRAERSQFDKAPLDSNKLGVYFSPQTMIDEDIIAQLGFTALDQYIGDPGDVDSRSYPQLIQAAKSYWKKYTDKNDINAYISIFALFDLSFFRQLDQLLPARTDKITGLLIKPNILERSKDTVLPKVYTYNHSYTGIITETQPTLTGEDDGQLQAYLTASNEQKYGGMIYSYEYLTRSGSTYITSSSPYWYSAGVQPIYIDAISSVDRYVSGSVTYSTGSGGTGVVASYGSGVYGTSTYYLDPQGPGWEGTLAQVQDYLPTGIRNHRFAGCKLTSPGFNINSTETVDGGPVVEWRTSNPNQLIYQTPGQQGSFLLV
jgi:hypothetical protein